jgi:hypothetical protein
LLTLERSLELMKTVHNVGMLRMEVYVSAADFGKIEILERKTITLILDSTKRAFDSSTDGIPYDNESDNRLNALRKHKSILTEVKKVIDSLDSNKTSIIDKIDVIRRKNALPYYKHTENNHLRTGPFTARVERQRQDEKCCVVS